MLAAHVEKGADITVGCIEVDRAEASAFGVMSIDSDGTIVAFDEKPPQPTAIPGKPDRALVSMGIYVFSTQVLFRQLRASWENPATDHDFGRNIIPDALDSCKVCAFHFSDGETGDNSYWRDVGTIDALWRANLELIGVSPELNLYDRNWPIWTYQAQVPPAKFVFDDDNRRGMAVDSMVAGGSIVSGSQLRHSLLFSHVRVHSYCEIEDTVLFPQVDIGRHCTIRRALIDRGCRIPAHTTIGCDPEADRARFRVTEEGVVLVTREMLGQNYHDD